MCQYSIDDYDPLQLSLNEIIYQFYSHQYEPTTFTCYVHLQCDRGPTPSCLDWSEICDGKIDCMDGGRDEEYCWQLEINDCENNEYRCNNGQCIPYEFFRDDSLIPDCLDRSDEVSTFNDKRADCHKSEPTFACEDVVCTTNLQYFNSPLTSSCVKQRTVIQRIFYPSTTIVRKINSSNRCEHINGLFNETIIKLHLLRRIKYYHVPCQRHSPKLSCFYDDIHLCLCNNHGSHRVANCFEFDHHMKSDCLGRSGCENGAQCFQDSSTCAQTSICVCPACFYGVRCQFSTSGFGLSLDTIL
ncbi:unnamed protein product, partial [Rotaria sp. Silwood1]